MGFAQNGRPISTQRPRPTPEAFALQPRELSKWRHNRKKTDKKRRNLLIWSCNRLTSWPDDVE